ncbi:HD domain-containing protein [Candidatus Magnetominusculus xianensis]|uniref:Oxetanocin n=1 Tax=Candidatus Magnetominusculus xianensis TaxID=1748249 RepID=A0ABR5SG73_9BACT|nr:HD domain-containing protein [Candidatus Magnetominusculus xianensis]KWT78291.1 oxetanocin [Candidatus Magnetominusculus xianensis]MBF0404020.1 HD domain-containing protein [Nitrospirota bacterium]
MDISLDDIVATLSKQPRTGWLIKGIEHPEMVSDHTFGTLFFSFLIKELYNSKIDLPKIDLPNLLAMTLVHDMQEIFTGDITPRLKSYFTQSLIGETYKDLEFMYLNKLLDYLPDKSKIFIGELFNEFCKEESLQAKIARKIDIAEMLAQAYEYEKIGHRRLDEFWSWADLCNNDDIISKLMDAIVRKRYFLQAVLSISYQRFESSCHHQSKELAERVKRIDYDRWSKRDTSIKDYFTQEHKLSSMDISINVLDVGCGLGSFSRFFLEEMPDTSIVDGIDINPFLLKEAHQRWSGRINTLSPCDIGWYWDIPSEEYNVILIGEVLEHVFNPRFVLMESFRVLKYRGLLIISVPNSFHKEKMERYETQQRIELRSQEQHIRYFSPQSIKEEVGYAGFKIIKMVGLEKEWVNSFDMDINDLLSEKPKDAWTILVFAEKMDEREINDIGIIPAPDRMGEDKTLYKFIKEHHMFNSYCKIHAFIEAVYKAKLLRFNIQDNNSETIAQQTFRLSFFALVIAIEFGYDSELAIKCVLLQGLEETHLCEFIHSIRALINLDTRRKAVDDLLSFLPSDIKDAILKTYDDNLYNDLSDEGAIARFLLQRDYMRHNINFKIINSYNYPFDKFISLINSLQNQYHHES